jgi:hypothetical protein
MRAIVWGLTAVTFFIAGTTLTDRAAADLLRLKSGGEVRCTTISKGGSMVNCACASGSLSFPETMIQDIVRDDIAGYAAAPVSPSASQAQVYGPGTREEALVEAVGRWDVQAVKKLLEAGADINGLYYKDPPRIQIAPDFRSGRSGNTAHPSSLSTGGVSGHTPLMLAAWRGNAAMVQLLLEKGANPNVRSTLDDQGRSTALYKAVMGSNQEVVRLILSRNPDAESLETAFEAIVHGSNLKAYLDIFLEHGISAECRHRVLAWAKEKSQSRAPILEAAYLKHSNLRK